MSKPKVLIYEPIHQKGLDYLSEYADIIWASGYDEDTISLEAVEAEGIIIRANGAVTAKIMDSAPYLKVIGRHGVGVDNIDVEAATKRGIYVVNTPGVNTEAVAEHAVGMMLALSKKIVESDRAMRNGNWNFRYESYGIEMQGSNLGIVGMGKIGYRVADICHAAFNMNIFYCDELANQKGETELSARKAVLSELLSISDYVSLHLPALPSTFQMINSENIGLMKGTAFLINTSRGTVIDNNALYNALKNSDIAGAALDVFEKEPLPDNSPLLSLANLILTPHNAAHTEQAMIGMAMVVKDIVSVIKGEMPKYPVNSL